ncbi:hypothetical protein PY365_16325 [Roseiarcaceae bacterium H3SJ34-1]|uniref:hypothetical protein n=1 Tax=Terripilifer ovatus TaxID=3032367 RepID=UPI003AB9B79F|nr:hypothetical protein [Roseiarcaceae bacterium H3SJ34-1]
MTGQSDAFNSDIYNAAGDTRGVQRAACIFLACMPVILTGFLAAGATTSATLPANTPMTVGLTELARFVGDFRLMQLSKAHWNLSLFWMAAGTVIFAWRGAVSDRRQGWSEGVWICVVAAVCIGSALLGQSGWGFLDQPVGRLTALSEDARPLDPRWALVMRTVWLMAFGGFIAIAAHDVAYRARRTLEEFDLIAPPDFAPVRFPDYAPQREPRARPAGGRKADPTSAEAGFGQRQALPPEMPRGEGMTRGEALLTLGLTTTATKKEIGRAFHAAMKTAHPDRGGSTARAARLNTARDILLGKRR